MSEPSGPIESRTWVKELSARAVTDSPERRIFGYDVEADLAPHYRFSDTLYLSLTGELPSERQSRAFEIVLQFASAMSIAEAPIHAAALGRLCGIRTGGVLGVASVALGESVDEILRSADTLLSTGETPAELPSHLRAGSDAERASVGRLSGLLSGLVDVPVLSKDPCRDVALLAGLHACGLTSAFQMTAALVLAALPSAIAESGAVRPGDFAGYPIDTPHFEYVNEPVDDGD